MKNIDFNFYPGWTRKAISFTIDDGHLDMDTKLINIIRPYGIKGSFNISSNNMTKHNDPDRIRKTYRGFEITNHVLLHPFAFADDADVILSDEFFNEETASKDVCYREEGTPEGVYLRYNTARERWSRYCTAKGYITLTNACKKELEEVFGEGSVRGFAWPFCRQNNSEVIEYLKSQYYGLRDAGRQNPVEDTAFLLPADRTNWRYNARHSNLLMRAAEYEALGDAGQRTWFCFGVHAVDFERDGKWEDLAEFAKTYGNRPEDFWYATNVEIFDYEDAVKAVIVEDGVIRNNSDITLYAKLDGKRITLCPGCEVKIEA